MYAVTIMDGSTELFIELFDEQVTAQQFASVEAYQHHRSYTIVDCMTQEEVASFEYTPNARVF